jgi:hypothetical protein
VREFADELLQLMAKVLSQQGQELWPWIPMPRDRDNQWNGTGILKKPMG